MINAILIVPFIASFFVTLFLLPSWIRRAKNAGLVGRDIQKFSEEKVPEAGGVTVLCGFAFGTMIYVAINTFVFGRADNFIEIFSFMSSLFFIAFVAFTDDILGWKIGLRRRTRIVLVAFASIPLIAINAGRDFISIPIIGLIDLGIVYPLVLIPLGIVGATVTFNFLAGFNGLEAGNGIIILAGLSIVSYYTGSPWLAIIGGCMIAALIAFLIFNFYPAKIFPGDSLTYSIGSLIAIMAILGNYEKIAAFFFIPVIIEVILKSRGKLVKQSFGKPQKDGSLDLLENKIYSLNHLAIWLMKKYRIKPTERRVVVSIWIFQIILVVAGLIIFKDGIFG